MPLLQKAKAFVIVAKHSQHFTEEENSLTSLALHRGTQRDVEKGSFDPWLEVSKVEYEVFRKYDPSLPAMCPECRGLEHHKMSCGTGGMKSQRLTIPMRVEAGTSDFKLSEEDTRKLLVSHSERVILEAELQEARAKIRRQRYQLRKQQKLLHAFIRENWNVGYARENEWVQKMEKLQQQLEEARDLARQLAGDPNALPWNGE